MHNSKIKRISLAVCLALMPLAANAAGLGKLTVLSGLGEPLNAEIELSASKDELSSLSARIAPVETYAEQGLDRPATLSALRVELGKQANGTPVIKLTSVQPVNDPFLDMLIQLEWSTGRLLREYTALLDPPGYGEQKTALAAAPQVSAPAGAGAVAQAAKPVQPSGKPGKARAHATPKGGSVQAEPAGQGEAYTTQSGDTLRSIARNMQVEGVSLEQMLVGLYRANKDAFVDGNMNRLKVGQIMRAPGNEELQSLSQQEAIKEIHVHSTDWHAYRHKLAGAVAEAAPEGEGARGQSASGKITAPAEDKAAPAAAGARDVVKLSKSDTTTAKPSGPETAASKLDKQSAGKEDATARAKAAKEADERVAALEKQLQDMQKLLQVKNQTLADMQKGAAAPDAKAQPAAPATPAPAEQKPVQEPAPKAEVKPTAAAPVEKASEAPAVAAPEAPKQPRKPRRTPPPVAPEPVAEPSLLDDPLMMGGIGGGLLALLGGGWFYLRNKRRKGLDSFEQGILTTSGLKPNTVFGNTAGGTVDTGDTSFLTDLSQGSGGMIDTNDVDPIAEAEVYMAYGRDVQAEEILKDAIGKDPRRYELHQKLLEIYSNRKDTTAFETLAGELYATLGAADPYWQKFAAMGRELEPSNPLYSAEIQSAASGHGKFAPTQEFSTAAQDTSLPLSGGEAPGVKNEQDNSLEFTAAPELEDNSLDFDLGAPEEVHAETSEPPAAAQSEEFPALDIERADEVPSPAAVEDIKDAGLDFNFDLPEPASAENVQLGAEELGLKPEPLAEVQETVMLEALPELSTAESSPPVAPEPVVEDIGFDLPDLDLGVTEAASPVVAAAEAETTQPELPEITFDLPAIAEEAAVQAEAPSLDIPAVGVDEMDNALLSLEQGNEPVAEEIVFDTAPEEEGALDFDFDAEIGEPSATEPQQSAALGLPDLNLSGISLDLDEALAPASAPAEAPSAPGVVEAISEPAGSVEEITLASDESADVDTKLDLVAAYMDMGDTEGARELLEEVLREGGPQQRDRAQTMLGTLG